MLSVSYYMILSFGNSNTGKIWKGDGVKEFRSFEDKAKNKLSLINGASSLDDLKSLP
jgi:plasmid maintenance system killer protein